MANGDYRDLTAVKYLQPGDGFETSRRREEKLCRVLARWLLWSRAGGVMAIFHENLIAVLHREATYRGKRCGCWTRGAANRAILLESDVDVFGGCLIRLHRFWLLTLNSGLCDCGAVYCANTRVYPFSVANQAWTRVLVER